MAGTFSDTARIQAMLDVEAALARAQAGAGLIPREAAFVIADAARAENFDPDELGQEVLKGGNLAIPLAKALTARVAARDEQAARWVHWGATSQDIIDTGLVLQMRGGIALIEERLDRLGEQLAARA
jgi:3-carboxy-cis,cis-muconate cycloisomerase